VIEFYNLPLGWSLTSLGELVLNIQYGYTASATEQAIGPKFLRITDLQNNSVNWDTVPFCPCDEIDKYKLKKGDIVIARTGATTGKSFLLNNLPEITVFASYLIRLETSNLCPPEYIALFMQSIDYWQQITVVSKGTAQPGANASILSKLSIPLPPLNELRRIVAKIEVLKARSQRVKEELEAIPAFLDQFRQSVLAAAFRGDLTADWREKNPDVEPASELLKQIQEERKTQYEQACIRAKAEGIRKPNPIQDISISLEKEEFQDIPNSWLWASLESISNFCRPITYGVIKLGDEVENGVPCLRTSDVKPLSIKLENVKKISRAIANNYSRTYLQGGELLVNVRGTLGGVAVVPEHLAGYNISREVAMVPILSNIPVTWTAYWVASVTAQTWLTNVSKGVAYTGINLEDLRQLPVPIPPVAEIKVAVETIEKLYFISSQIEQQYNEAKAHLDKLDQSILAKAFRGELVPQDPNDEPASVLLERIRAERENLDTKKKAKGKTEKKSGKAKPEAAEPEQLSLPGFE